MKTESEQGLETDGGALHREVNTHTWTWVQPGSRDDLLRRLEEAVFLRVAERERETQRLIARMKESGYLQ